MEKHDPTEKPVPATEFVRNFGRYQDAAIAGDIVRVSSHGRVVGGFLSEVMLADYERLKRRERKVLVLGALPDDAVEAIAAADYGAAPE